MELSALKNNAMESNKLWLSVGKPVSGPVADEQKRDKYAYKLAIKKEQKTAKEEITDSHNASTNTK